jgi:Cu2+-exporting ATPase
VSGKSGIHDFAKDLPKEEHIVLSISGMSCTGCETKLKRTLAPLKSVKNLKTSLVLARAEFDIDSSAGSTAEVIKHLERTTEFKCERIRDKGSNITFTVPSDSSHFLNQDWPRGVTEITTLDQTTINVTFDTKITGPRELMENGWNAPLGLALPREDPTLETSSKHVRHMGYMTLLSIFLTVPVLVLAWAPLPERKVVYGSVSLALTSVIQFVVAGPFYPKALKSLIFSRILEMDLLIVLSTTAAFIYSVVSFGYVTAGQPLPTDEFFETSALLVTLIMVGRYVAALARQKAIESISLRSLQTSTAILVDECGGNEQEIDSRLLQHGDFFKVLPDSTIPTDGTVILGSSEVDESMVTGETIPVEKYHKSTVIAGSINGSGTLIVRLTRLPGDNTITVITEMVDEAKLSKPRTQKIADRVAGYFVPAVVALTIFTFVIWTSIGVAVQNQPGSEATIRAITYAITVLIVSCPCAIGLAVPMVMVVASGVAAERGVIFKSADSIEVAYKASHAVFDKTGTLTHGKLTVVHEKYLGESPRSSMSLLLGLIGDVKHPVATAVAAHIKAKDITSSVVLDSKALTGKGVKGTSSGHVLRAGNSRWLNVSSNTYVQWVLAQGCTAFCFTIDDSLVAVFGLKDSLRADSLQTVTKLQEHGISVHIVSGDDEGAVRSVASMLNVPNTNIRSQCTPANKQEYIQALLSISKRKVIGKRYEKAVVIFCGDGTNDAVALSQATIGVHMHEGTDVAKSAADVVLMRPGLTGILTMLAISEKSMRRIKFNFAWSFVYNLFAILLGAGAFVNARIPPGFAGLGELVSVVPVITAAVLLRWSKI